LNDLLFKKKNRWDALALVKRPGSVKNQKLPLN